MIAVLLGSTGLVGTELLQQLLAEPRITKLKAISRKPLSVQNAKLETVLIPELSELYNRRKDLSGHLYFSALGTTIKKAGSQASFREVDFQGNYDFARIAQQNQAFCFSLVSATGANSDSPIFYNRVKGETEDAIRALKLSSVHFFRPALLIGDRQEHRPAEKMAESLFQVFARFVSDEKLKFVATRADLLARRMINESFSETTGIKVFKAQEI